MEERQLPGGETRADVGVHVDEEGAVTDDVDEELAAVVQAKGWVGLRELSRERVEVETALPEWLQLRLFATSDGGIGGLRRDVTGQ